MEEIWRSRKSNEALKGYSYTAGQIKSRKNGPTNKLVFISSDIGCSSFSTYSSQINWRQGSMTPCTVIYHRPKFIVLFKETFKSVRSYETLNSSCQIHQNKLLIKSHNHLAHVFLNLLRLSNFHISIFISSISSICSHFNKQNHASQ